MRLTFRCEMAVTLPTVMVATARIQRTFDPPRRHRAEADRQHARERRERAAFTPTAMNAVIVVGAPS
jgi:hypothetical protein